MAPTLHEWSVGAQAIFDWCRPPLSSLSQKQISPTKILRRTRTLREKSSGSWNDWRWPRRSEPKSRLAPAAYLKFHESVLRKSVDWVKRYARQIATAGEPRPDLALSDQRPADNLPRRWVRANEASPCCCACAGLVSDGAWKWMSRDRRSHPCV
jgi:hypothetical protein